MDKAEMSIGAFLLPSSQISWVFRPLSVDKCPVTRLSNDGKTDKGLFIYLE